MFSILIASSTMVVFAEEIASNKNKYEIIMDLQEEAVIAYQNMMRVFDPTGNFKFTYPSEYAGSYISDDNRLVICLTDTSKDKILKYERLCKNSSILVFKQVEYSNDELQELAETVYEYYGQDSVVDIGISFKDNGIDIGMESSDFANKSNKIEEGIKKNSSFSDEKSLPIKTHYSKKAKETTGLIGGYAIKNSAGNGFTLGICGTYNGSNAFMTCGHDQKVGDSIYNSSGTKIGEVVVKQFTSGAYYDYSIVKITNTSFTTTNKVYGSGSSQLSITGVSTYPVEGTTVYKYGKNGGYGYGKVASSNTTVSYSSGYVISGLTKVTLTTGTIVSGDSGGPCYFNSKISGVISGSTGTTTLYYSPILTGSFKAKTS